MGDRARARDVSGRRLVAVGGLLALGVLVASCAGLVDLERVTYGDPGFEGERDAELANEGGPRDAQDVLEDATKPGEGSAPGDAAACGVRGDGKLYCTNRANAPLYAQPKVSAALVNTIRTTSSYFLCWGAGERHAGGNTTWYYTIGDDNPNLGWTPGVMLNTPDAFDANPRAFGLRNCAD